jgi:hypothetical protein
VNVRAMDMESIKKIHGAEKTPGFVVVKTLYIYIYAHELLYIYMKYIYICEAYIYMKHVYIYMKYYTYIYIYTLNVLYRTLTCVCEINIHV